ESIHPTKIRILDTVWDDRLREGGRVLAEETDKAFQAIDAATDWAFYIQGDEVLHEKYHPAIRKAMETYLDDRTVEGLLFNYLHFYGSYDYVGASSRWYRKEIRIVRKDPRIYSYRDAQGFRLGADQKLRVKPIDAFIYHYGWVKDPRVMQQKQQNFNRYWHNDEWIDTHVAKAEAFDYSEIDQLQRFEGSHPAVMQARIQQKNWTFDHDISTTRLSLKERLRNWVEQQTGHRLGEYRNYKLVD
ncbi:MAG: glycosyltransferase family 2 protein, partial [Phaeodactylibacter sp.]|nr:glycosyltransferase family 2 protein [Phaeodactylibacter sp.]